MSAANEIVISLKQHRWVLEVLSLQRVWKRGERVRKGWWLEVKAMLDRANCTAFLVYPAWFQSTKTNELTLGMV